MGRFFFVEAKSFEFVIEPWGNSLRLSIVERGIGYLRSVFLEKGAVVWLLSMLGGSVGGGAFIIIPEGKHKWEWCSFEEVSSILKGSLFLNETEVKEADLPSLEFQAVPGHQSYAQVVEEQGRPPLTAM